MAVSEGRNVLVSAPTGSGKTVVGEMAVRDALAGGGRVFYTTPVKALSNQKFNDLRTVLGDPSVGLLTGDHAIHPGAPVVVMTTEVLRNMLYARSEALDGLQWVVLDEVHFLQDTYRGPVWEEVLIHAPLGVRFVCLSATVSNAEELGEWIRALRGPTTVVIEHRRPVELDCLYLVDDRHATRAHLLPLLVEGRPNPRGQRFDADLGTRSGGGSRSRPRRRFRTPRRLEVLERLREEDLLPSIVFIFSRAGCEDAVASCREAGLRLTDGDEAARIREIADRHGLVLRDADLDVLGFDLWRETLAMGLAAHHAGMVPAFREAVEECFVQGLVKAVFATETLALGINMPARSVVIERLTKFTGEGHDMLTPAQFTQLTGRAGRRGIDEHGAAVVLWNPFVPFQRVAELAASREFTLQSAFRPSYNMAVNLIERNDREHAQRVLARSFAQFQTDRSLTTLRERAERARVELHELDAAPASAAVPAASLEEYRRLVAELRAAARPPGSTTTEREAAIAALRPGDVVQLPGQDAPELAVVLSVAQRRGTRAELVTSKGRVRRLDPSRPAPTVRAVGKVDLPVPYTPRDPAFRRQAAARLRRLNPRKLRLGAQRAEGKRLTELKDLVAAHPVHAREDREDLLRQTRARTRILGELARTEAQLDRRGTDLVARFDRVVEVLARFDHVEGWTLTGSGRRLRRIYHECDLLVSLLVDASLLDGLDAAGVAAVVSCVTHEHRSADPPPPPSLPTPLLQDRFAQLVALSRELHDVERSAGLGETRAPSAGFATAAHRWVSGYPLEQVLEEEMSGGDFVRNARSLTDLLRQLRDVVPGEAGRACGRAAELLRRDVVEAGGGPL
jgi:ATP-dependent RNA helicase HelY